MTPGPTPVPPEVLAAIAQPVIHHRGPDYRDALRACLGRLREVFRTEYEVLLFTASGTGAMESAVANLCSPGERCSSSRPATSASAGPRSRKALRRRRRPRSATPGARRPSADDLAARLREREATRVVLLTHSETSTGVVADLQALAAVAQEAGALVVVDAISSLGAVPLETDAWGLDVVVSGSQKALMTPPGLAMVSVSRGRLGRRARRRPRRASTWTGSARARAQAKLDAPFTPPISLVVGARRRARDAARGGPRGRVRAPRAPRPRLPRGR